MPGKPIKFELTSLVPLFKELEKLTIVTPAHFLSWQKKYPLPGGKLLTKTDLIADYEQLAGTHGLAPFNPRNIAKLKMKPTRTMSGVAPVTVLTKPYPCPGNCLFCPSDVRMPKSYLASEPGAQRAEHNYFDPYLQTYNRLQALAQMGHPVDKVELIILGGTWSDYPLPYQRWFVRECFRALNDFGQRDDRAALEQHYQQLAESWSKFNQPFLSNNQELNEQTFAGYQIDGQLDGQRPEKNYNQLVNDLYAQPEQKLGVTERQTASWAELAAAQLTNESATCRNVGLVLETRPDQITPAEVVQLRRLGATKIQLGIQSLQDQVLKLNRRGHDRATTARAINLLRQAGFKIHGHWMPNLYGSDVAHDQVDYHELFSDPSFCPDELKIYPCSLLASAPLMQFYQSGQWRPYTSEELVTVLSDCLTHTPPYCRLTRIVRDIPSFEIVAGNKKTNFRQIVDQKLASLDQEATDIRAREIRQLPFDPREIYWEKYQYSTTVSQEYFLQALVKPIIQQNQSPPNSVLAGTPKLLGFLRLSLPTVPANWPELTDSAIIREVHVYGQLVALGQAATGRAQHLGLGSKLIAQAKEIARQAGFTKLAVISAVGTRPYYRQRGFEDGQLYQFADLTAAA